MQVPATVVVNAAGRGTRLGSDLPKALLEVEGRPLVAWQLALLADVPDVRVVLGHEAAAVADVVFAVRDDVTVVLNHEYATTGTAASLMRGAAGAPGLVVSLDCDLVVHPGDLAAFVAEPVVQLGVTAVQSDEPVFVEVTGEPGALAARRFDRAPSAGAWEWSGLVAFDPADPRLGRRDRHVFELVEGLLPMPARVVRAREVDFPDEVAALAAWVRQLREEGLLP